MIIAANTQTQDTASLLWLLLLLTLRPLPTRRPGVSEREIQTFVIGITAAAAVRNFRWTCLCIPHHGDVISTCIVGVFH